MWVNLRSTEFARQRNIFFFLNCDIQHLKRNMTSVLLNTRLFEAVQNHYIASITLIYKERCLELVCD